METPTDSDSVKIEKLTKVGESVQAALDRRTFWLAAGVIVPLFVGVILLWNINSSAKEAEVHARKGEIQAQRAYLQALENARILTVNQITFAQTRDCPVQYLRALTIASRAKEDVSAVKPPCDPIDLTPLEAELSIREAIIKSETERLKRLEGDK